MAEKLIMAGGIYHFFFAVFHLLFWKLFDWKNNLASLSSVNKAIMQVLNLCLTFVFFIFGLLSLVYPVQMVQTELGQTLVWMIAVFWLFRAVEQVVFFKLRHWSSWVFLFIFAGGVSLYGTVLFLT